MQLDRGSEICALVNDLYIHNLYTVIRVTFQSYALFSTCETPGVLCVVTVHTRLACNIFDRVQLQKV